MGRSALDHINGWLTEGDTQGRGRGRAVPEQVAPLGRNCAPTSPVFGDEPAATAKATATAARTNRPSAQNDDTSALIAPLPVLSPRTHLPSPVNRLRTSPTDCPLGPPTDQRAGNTMPGQPVPHDQRGSDRCPGRVTAPVESSGALTNDAVINGPTAQGNVGGAPGRASNSTPMWSSWAIALNIDGNHQIGTTARDDMASKGTKGGEPSKILDIHISVDGRPPVAIVALDCVKGDRSYPVCGTNARNSENGGHAGAAVARAASVPGALAFRPRHSASGI